jgi:hypothetical protein
MKGQLPVRQRSTSPWGSRTSSVLAVVLRLGKKRVTPWSIQSELSVAEKSYSVDFEKNKEGFFFTPILINDILKT